MIKTINDVIVRQNKIIESAKLHKARFGYFAALYLEMTQTVKQHIEQGKFDDVARMEQLVVVFANRYFDAYEKWQAKKTTTKSWQIALDETKINNITVIQHLLCSINAHINLDLGIAAAQICPGHKIEGLKADFERINNILAFLLDSVQIKLGKINWPMRFLDRIGKNRDEQLANFSLGIARKSAWLIAVDLAKSSVSQQPGYINLLDKKTSQLAKLIINPGAMANLLLKPIKIFEPSDPTKIIAILKS